MQNKKSQVSSNSVNRHNRMPARYLQNIFEDTQEIELHGKNLVDAKEAVIRALDSAQQNKIKKIFFITGRGNHSKGNVPVLRPMVLKVCKERGFNPTLSQNKGTIICAVN